MDVSSARNQNSNVKRRASLRIIAGIFLWPSPDAPAGDHLKKLKGGIILRVFTQGYFFII